VNKTDHLEDLILSHSPDIIIGTESWLAVDINSYEIFPPNYVVYRRDRTGSIGGGVFIAVKNDIQSTEESNEYQTEMLSVNIGTVCGRIHLCAVYRPPSSSEQKNP